MPIVDSTESTLLDYLYQANLSLVVISFDGAIELMTPMAAQLLMPVTQGQPMLNLFDMLHPVLPMLRQLVRENTDGVVCEGIPFQVMLGRHHSHLILTLNWVAQDKLLATLRDETKAVVQRRTNQEASEALLAARTAELTQAHTQMESVLNALPMMVGCWNVDLTLRFANNFYADWYQSRHNTMAGTHIAALLGVTLAELSAPYIRTVLGGIPQSFEREYITADGQARYTMVHYFPDVLEGTVQGFYEVMSDITRNKQSQLALSASETLLRRAGHLANMGAWAIDLKTRKLYWSEYMYELHGVSQDFVPSLENALIFYSPEDRKLIQLAIKNTIEHQIPWELEIPLITEAGIQKWVHGVGDVEYEEGHPVRIVGALQDVTVQLLERIQMQNLLHVAEEASKAKAQFLANMSHEIRTPMNAIKGMLKLLEQSKLTSNQHDYVSKAEGATKSLLSIINDVLDFSKIDAGKMELERASFHVDTMLRELSVILSSNLGRKHIEILFDVDPAVPETLIGDSLRLQQVLINLGSNAIKFTDTGEVIVKLELLRSDSRGCLLKFSVTDTGIGIASQSLERIFEGFSQAESSTTRKHGGTGLGLTISKRMISLMGGELKVESTLGLGSVFSFALNLAIAENALEAPVENFANNIAGADSFDVLVVDDNPLACKLTVLMAKQCGWNVNAASNGLEAIAMVENRLASGMRPFGAALLDWNMPGIDGWETAARMRALSAPNPPIIVMVTSSTREELASRSELEQDALGDYLVKPVTATMLRESVGKARKGNRGMRNQKLKAVQSERGLVGMRILVVEDNMINQQVAEELLKAQGASVSIACNGQLGVDAVRGASPQFDVVLMDLQMPVMDGLTAARVLRQEFGKDALPIIAMTANAMASDRAACLEAGMNDHIGKPFDLSELVRNIVKHTGWSVAADNFALPIVHSAGEATNLVGFPWPDCLDGVHAIARMGGNVSLFERSLAKYLELLSAHSQTMQNLIAQGDIEATRRDFHSLKSNSASLGVLAIAALAAQCEKMTIHASTERLAPQTEELQALIASLLPSLRQAHAALGERLNEVFRLSGGTDSQDSLAGYRVALQELLDQLTAGDMTAMETHAALRQRIEPAWADLFDPLDISMAEMEFELAAVHCKTLLARQKS